MSSLPRHATDSRADTVVSSTLDTATHLRDEVAVLRHELRNALLPLRLHFDLLDLHARGEAPPAAAPADDVAATIQRLANGLLLRVTQRAPLEIPRRLDLTAWWHDIGDLVLAALAPSTRTTVAFPPRLPPVIADPAILAHIILHVLAAIRLTQGAQNRPVQITARRRGRGVSVALRDTTGPLPFRRPGSELPTAQRWGMALAHSVLRQTGGTLTSATRTGYGTQVVLRLATAADDLSHRARLQVSPALRTRTAASIPHMADPLGPAEPRRLLLIDDNAALTQALALRLDLHGGFECLPPLHSLRDAIRHVAQHTPSIVLLDLNLPGDERPLDFIRALAHLRHAVHIVVLTGNPSWQAVDATRAAGAAGFIAKGVTAERLLDALNRVGREAFVLALDN